MRLWIAKILCYVGTLSSYLIPYDVTNLSYWIYRTFLFTSMRLDKDKEIFKYPDEWRKDIIAKLKIPPK